MFAEVVNAERDAELSANFAPHSDFEWHAPAPPAPAEDL